MSKPSGHQPGIVARTIDSGATSRQGVKRRSRGVATQPTNARISGTTPT